MRHWRRLPVWAWLPLLVLPLAGVAAQVERGQRLSRPQPARVYEGVSQRGQLQEALDDAVRRAARSQPGADRLVRWRLAEITGEAGGIRGLNTVRVRIEMNDEVPRPPSGPGTPGGEEAF